MQQQSRKWTSENPNIKVGEIVIVRDSSKSRSFWPLARVESTKIGRDGKVRSVELRTRQGLLRGAIQHFVPLEISAESGTEECQKVSEE